MAFDLTRPFNALPLLPPEIELEAIPVLKACIEARAALAELKAGVAQRQSASVYLKTLAGIGVLEEMKVGRERLFINPPLMRLLTSHHGE
jgi:hypothetical protein